MQTVITLGVQGGKDAAKDIADVGKASEETGKKLNKAGDAADKLKKKAKETKEIKDALREATGGIGDFISNATSGWAGAIRIATDVASFALNVGEKLTAGASIYQEVDFGKATQQQRGLEDSATRLTFRTGESAEGILNKTRGVSEAIGENQEAVLHAATSYVALSNSTKGVGGALEVIGDVANQSGRKMEDVVPRAASIGRAFGTTGEQLRSSFSAIERISNEAGNTGGLIAFEGTVASLGPQLEQMGIKTDEARNKILALIAAAGKGLNPKEGAQVASKLFSSIESNAFHISRILGHDILDESGHVKDYKGTAKELQAYAFKHRGGKGSKRALWALRQFLGNVGGSQLAHMNFDEVEDHAKVASKPNPPAPKKTFSSSPAGGRNVFDAKLGNQILETGQENLNILDEAQSKEKNMRSLVNKMRALDMMPGFLARFEKLTEIELNRAGGRKRLEQTNPKLAAKRQKEREENDREFKKRHPRMFGTHKDPWAPVEKESPPIAPPTADEQKKYNQAITQLLLRMDNTFKVLPQNLVTALKGSNFYVKDPIIKPTEAPPGSQNPPTNP